MRPKQHTALVIVGHGSTVNPGSGASTLAHAGEIRRRGLFAEVACAFWKGQPALQDALSALRSREIYIVPNFMSEGYFTREIIPREMGLHGALTKQGGRVLKYCRPVGNHPGMTGLLLRRAASVSPGIPREQTSLMIVGHGTGRNENSAEAVKREVKKIRALNLYAEVAGAFMEQKPRVDGWLELTAQPYVVVVPMFISDGPHSTRDVPVQLGIVSEPETAFQRNPHRLHGRDLYYSGPVGADPGFAEMILEQVETFDRGGDPPQ